MTNAASAFIFTQFSDSHVCFGLFPRGIMFLLVRAKKLGHDSVFGVLIARGGFNGRPLVQ